MKIVDIWVQVCAQRKERRGVGVAVFVCRSMSGGATNLEKVHFAIERLLDSPDGWRSLVREMVARWPDDPASEITYSLVRAAFEIEAMFSEGSPARVGAGQGWKLAALLGLDFYAMDSLGMPHIKASDMAGYWKIDPFFREL